MGPAPPQESAVQSAECTERVFPLVLRVQCDEFPRAWYASEWFRGAAVSEAAPVYQQLGHPDRELALKGGEWQLSSGYHWAIRTVRAKGRPPQAVGRLEWEGCDGEPRTLSVSETQATPDLMAAWHQSEAQQQALSAAAARAEKMYAAELRAAQERAATAEAAARREREAAHSAQQRADDQTRQQAEALRLLAARLSAVEGRTAAQQPVPGLEAPRGDFVARGNAEAFEPPGAACPAARALARRTAELEAARAEWAAEAEQSAALRRRAEDTHAALLRTESAERDLRAQVEREAERGIAAEEALTREAERCGATESALERETARRDAAEAALRHLAAEHSRLQAELARLRGAAAQPAPGPPQSATPRPPSRGPGEPAVRLQVRAQQVVSAEGAPGPGAEAATPAQ